MIQIELLLKQNKIIKQSFSGHVEFAKFKQLCIKNLNVDLLLAIYKYPFLIWDNS